MTGELAIRATQDRETLAKAERKCRFVAHQDLGSEVPVTGSDRLTQQLPANTMSELRWIDVQPGQFSLREGNETLHLAMQLGNEDAPIEQPLILRGHLQAQEGIRESSRLQLVQPCRVVDDAEPLPIARHVRTDLHAVPGVRRASWASTSDTRIRSAGTSSSLNHGLRLSHRLLRGLG